jgi:alkyl hydroperoxide reductase subunit AhpF
MSDLDLAVIGGGPSGLIAASYALHARLRTGVFTRELGGKVNYPFALRNLERTEPVWGATLVHEFEKRLIEHPDLYHDQREIVAIRRGEDNLFYLKPAKPSGTVPDVTQSLAHSDETSQPIVARSVIIATGAAPQRLYVSGEKEYWGRGVSFSAISHAPYFAGRDVAVVGSGRRALVAALELSPICRHVYFIAANYQAFGDLPEADRVRSQHNVTVFSNWEVQQIVGDDFVTGIGLVGANGETRRLNVEGVFVELALLPNNELVRGVVELDQDGHICVDHRCATNVPGLFAAGDVTNIHVEQVLVAVGEGAKAALSAWEYLAVHP